MSKTVCYSSLNPRPFKKHLEISSIVSTLVCKNKFKIVDKEKEIVEVYTDVCYEDSIDTDKVSQSFWREAGIKALARKVAFNDLGTIYDDSNSILNADALPSDMIQASDIIHQGESAKKVFDSMPKELTKNMSVEDFIASYKQEDLINYINSLYAKQKSVSGEKKEVKDHE